MPSRSARVSGEHISEIHIERTYDHIFVCESRYDDENPRPDLFILMVLGDLGEDYSQRG